MVTGSRGIHVVSPLRRGNDFGTVHSYARSLAERMVAEDPGRLTLEWRKADRGKKIYVDVNRINYAQHAVAAYGVRARPKAPVAMPIAWEELSERTLRPDRWTIATCSERIADIGNPWEGFGRRARALPV
jgi:bifunctional non-homologous end joining protein LigD